MNDTGGQVYARARAIMCKCSRSGCDDQSARPASLTSLGFFVGLMRPNTLIPALGMAPRSCMSRKQVVRINQEAETLMNLHPFFAALPLLRTSRSLVCCSTSQPHDHMAVGSIAMCHCQLSVPSGFSIRASLRGMSDCVCRLDSGSDLAMAK